jgi:hypothetical protein
MCPMFYRALKCTLLQRESDLGCPALARFTK